MSGSYDISATSHSSQMSKPHINHITAQHEAPKKHKEERTDWLQRLVFVWCGKSKTMLKTVMSRIPIQLGQGPANFTFVLFYHTALLLAPYLITTCIINEV